MRGAAKSCAGVWNTMCPSPWRSASRRARSSITGDRSTAVTEPGRRASGSASRPGPQPYSRIDIGANCGDSPASMTRQHPRHHGLAAREELALVLGRQVGAEESRVRQDGEVRLAGRERLEASDPCASQHPPGRSAAPGAAGRAAAGRRRARRTSSSRSRRGRSPRSSEIGRQRDRLIEVRRRDRTPRPRDRRPARGRAARRRSSAAATPRRGAASRAADGTHPQRRLLAHPPPGLFLGQVELRLLPARCRSRTSARPAAARRTARGTRAPTDVTSSGT